MHLFTSCFTLIFAILHINKYVAPYYMILEVLLAEDAPLNIRHQNSDADARKNQSGGRTEEVHPTFNSPV